MPTHWALRMPCALLSRQSATICVSTVSACIAATACLSHNHLLFNVPLHIAVCQLSFRNPAGRLGLAAPRQRAGLPGGVRDGAAGLRLVRLQRGHGGLLPEARRRARDLPLAHLHLHRAGAARVSVHAPCCLSETTCIVHASVARMRAWVHLVRVTCQAWGLCNFWRAASFLLCGHRHDAFTQERPSHAYVGSNAPSGPCRRKTWWCSTSPAAPGKPISARGRPTMA